jgi:hypothetical protein
LYYKYRYQCKEKVGKRVKISTLWEIKKFYFKNRPKELKKKQRKNPELPYITQKFSIEDLAKITSSSPSFSFFHHCLFKNKRRKKSSTTHHTNSLIPAHECQHTHGRSNSSLQLPANLTTTISTFLSKTKAFINSKPTSLSLPPPPIANP